MLIPQAKKRCFNHRTSVNASCMTSRLWRRSTKPSNLTLLLTKTELSKLQLLHRSWSKTQIITKLKTFVDKQSSRCPFEKSKEDLCSADIARKWKKRNSLRSRHYNLSNCFFQYPGVPRCGNSKRALPTHLLPMGQTRCAHPAPAPRSRRRWTSAGANRPASPRIRETCRSFQQLVSMETEQKSVQNHDATYRQTTTNL